jgi:hypothetical protein
MSDNE